MNFFTQVRKTLVSAAKIASPLAALSAAGVAAIALIPTSAQAQTIVSDGGVSVTIDPLNGAIEDLTFAGSDFYNPGTPVSDFGFQKGTDTSSFSVNTTRGGDIGTISISSVSLIDDSIVAMGTYMDTIDFKRTYSFHDGFDVLHTTIELINRGTDEVALRSFDTFDPDQGIARGNGFGTFNDVLDVETSKGTMKVGKASETDGLTVVMGGSTDLTVASGNPFNIGTGAQLNSFFAAPFDGDGAFADLGTHVGFECLLDAGASCTYSFHQAYGLTMDDALDEFIDSKEAPEPASVVGLLALGAIGTSAALKRKRQQGR